MKVEPNTKVALVTGASRGIGEAIARRLSSDGLFVIATATSRSGVERINGHLGSGGIGLEMRLEEEDSVGKCVQEILDGYDAVDVIVNNAGITRDNLLVRMKYEEWKEVIDINLSGIYGVVKPLLRGMMKKRWGRIVNISSVVGRMGNPGQSNYAASKAGMEGFTRSLAQEIGTRGITVNCVSPGYIETDMTRDLSQEQVEEIKSRVSVGRLGRGEDVSALVSFLASEEASYITGETIQINGGLYYF